jgi:hypothetical protein
VKGKDPNPELKPVYRAEVTNPNVIINRSKNSDKSDTLEEIYKAKSQSTIAQYKEASKELDDDLAQQQIKSSELLAQRKNLKTDLTSSVVGETTPADVKKKTERVRIQAWGENPTGGKKTKNQRNKKNKTKKRHTL